MVYLHGNALSSPADVAPLVALPHLRRVTLFNNPLCFLPYKRRVQGAIAAEWAATAAASGAADVGSGEAGRRMAVAQWPLHRIPVPGLPRVGDEGIPAPGSTTVPLRLPTPLPAVTLQDAAAYRRSVLEHLPSSVICLDNHLVVPAERPIDHVMSSMAAVESGADLAPRIDPAAAPGEVASSMLQAQAGAAVGQAGVEASRTMSLRGDLRSYSLAPLTDSLSVPPPQFDEGAPAHAHIGVTVLEVKWLCEKYAGEVDASGLPPNVALLHRSDAEQPSAPAHASPERDMTGLSAASSVHSSGGALVFTQPEGVQQQVSKDSLRLGPASAPSWIIAAVPAIIAVQRGVRRYLWRTRMNRDVRAWLKSAGMHELAQDMQHMRMTAGVRLVQRAFRARRSLVRHTRAACAIQRAVRGHLARLHCLAVWIARHARAQAMLTPTAAIAVPGSGATPADVPRAMQGLLAWAGASPSGAPATVHLTGPSLPAMGCHDAGLSIMVPRGMSRPLRSLAEKALTASVSATITSAYYHKVAIAMESLAASLVSIRLCVLWRRHAGYIGVTGAVSRAHKWLLTAAATAQSEAAEHAAALKAASLRQRQHADAAVARVKQAARARGRKPLVVPPSPTVRSSQKSALFSPPHSGAGGKVTFAPTPSTSRAESTNGADENPYGIQGEVPPGLNETSSVALHALVSDLGRWEPYVVHFLPELRHARRPGGLLWQQQQTFLRGQSSGDAATASSTYGVSWGVRLWRAARRQLLQSIPPFCMRSGGGEGGVDAGADPAVATSIASFPWMAHPRTQRRLLKSRHKRAHPTLYATLSELQAVGVTANAAAAGRRAVAARLSQSQGTTTRPKAGASAHIPVSGGVAVPGHRPQVHSVPLDPLHETTPLVYWSDSEEEEGRAAPPDPPAPLEHVHPSMQSAVCLAQQVQVLTAQVLQAYVHWWVAVTHRHPKAHVPTPDPPGPTPLSTAERFWSAGRPTSAALYRKQRRLSAARLATLAMGAVSPHRRPNAATGPSGPPSPSARQSVGRTISPSRPHRGPADAASPASTRRPQLQVATSPGATGFRAGAPHSPQRQPLDTPHTGVMGSPRSVAATGAAGVLTTATGQFIYPWPLAQRALHRAVKRAQRSLVEVAAQFPSVRSIWKAVGLPYIDVSARGSRATPSADGRPIPAQRGGQGGATGFPTTSPASQQERVVGGSTPWMLRHVVAAPTIPHSAAYSILRKQAAAQARRVATLCRGDAEEFVSQAVKYVAVTGEMPSTGVFADLQGGSGEQSETAFDPVAAARQPKDIPTSIGLVSHSKAFRQRLAGHIASLLPPGAPEPAVRGAPLGVGEVGLPPSPWVLLAPVTPAAAHITLRLALEHAAGRTPDQFSSNFAAVRGPIVGWHTAGVGRSLLPVAAQGPTRAASGSPRNDQMCGRGRHPPASTASSAEVFATDAGACHSMSLRLQGLWAGGARHLHTPSHFYAMEPPEDASLPLPHGGRVPVTSEEAEPASSRSAPSQCGVAELGAAAAASAHAALQAWTQPEAAARHDDTAGGEGGKCGNEVFLTSAGITASTQSAAAVPPVAELLDAWVPSAIAAHHPPAAPRALDMPVFAPLARESPEAAPCARSALHVAAAAVGVCGAFSEAALNKYLPADALHPDPVNTLIPPQDNAGFEPSLMQGQRTTFTRVVEGQSPDVGGTEGARAAADEYMHAPGHALPLQHLVPDVAMLRSQWRQLLAAAGEVEAASRWLDRQVSALPQPVQPKRASAAEGKAGQPAAGQQPGPYRLQHLTHAKVSSTLQPCAVHLQHVVQSPLLPFTMGGLSSAASGGREASLTWLHKQVSAGERQADGGEDSILKHIVSILTHHRNARLLRSQAGVVHARQASRDGSSGGALAKGPVSAAAGQLIPATVKVDQYLPAAALSRALGVITAFAGPTEDVTVTAGLGAVLVAGQDPSSGRPTAGVLTGSSTASQAGDAATSLSSTVLSTRQRTVLGKAREDAIARGETGEVPGVWEDAAGGEGDPTHLPNCTGLGVVLQGAFGGDSLALDPVSGVAVAIPPTALPVVGVRLLTGTAAAAGVVLLRRPALHRALRRKRAKRIRQAAKAHGMSTVLDMHDLHCSVAKGGAEGVAGMAPDLLAILRMPSAGGLLSGWGLPGAGARPPPAAGRTRYTSDGTLASAPLPFTRLFGGTARVRAALAALVPRTPLDIRSLIDTSWLPKERYGQSMRQSRADQADLLRAWHSKQQQQQGAAREGRSGAQADTVQGSADQRGDFIGRWARTRVAGFKQPHQLIPPPKATYETYTAASPRDLARLLLRLRPWTAAMRRACMAEIAPAGTSHAAHSASHSTLQLEGGEVPRSASMDGRGDTDGAKGVDQPDAPSSHFVVSQALGLLQSSAARAWQHEQDVTKIAARALPVEGHEVGLEPGGSGHKTVARARRSLHLAEGALGSDVVPDAHMGGSKSTPVLRQASPPTRQQSVSRSISSRSIASIASAAGTERDTLHPILPPCTLMPVWAVDAVAAATAIQAAWRSHSTRVSLSPAAPLQVLQLRAATAIQRAFRARKFARRMSMIRGIAGAVRRVTACGCRTLFIEADVVAALAFGGVGCIGAGDGLYGWGDPRHTKPEAEAARAERATDKQRQLRQHSSLVTRSVAGGLAAALRASERDATDREGSPSRVPTKPPQGKTRPSARPPVHRTLTVRGSTQFGAEGVVAVGAAAKEITPQERMLQAHVHDWVDLRAVRPWMTASLPEHELVVHLEPQQKQTNRLRRKLKGLGKADVDLPDGPGTAITLSTVRPFRPPESWRELRVGLPLWLQLFTAKGPMDHGSRFALASLKEALAPTLAEGPDGADSDDSTASRVQVGRLLAAIAPMRLSVAKDGVPWLSEHSLVVSFASPQPSAARYLRFVDPAVHPLAAAVPLVSAGTRVELVEYAGALQWSVAWASRADHEEEEHENFTVAWPRVDSAKLHWQCRTQRLFAVQFSSLTEARLRTALLTALTWHAPTGTSACFLTPAQLMQEETLVPTAWCSAFGRTTQRNSIAREAKGEASRRPGQATTVAEDGFFSGDDDVTGVADGMQASESSARVGAKLGIAPGAPPSPATSAVRLLQGADAWRSGAARATVAETLRETGSSGGAAFKPSVVTSPKREPGQSLADAATLSRLHASAAQADPQPYAVATAVGGRELAAAPPLQPPADLQLPSHTEGWDAVHVRREGFKAALVPGQRPGLPAGMAPSTALVAPSDSYLYAVGDGTSLFHQQLRDRLRPSDIHNAARVPGEEGLKLGRRADRVLREATEAAVSAALAVRPLLGGEQKEETASHTLQRAVALTAAMAPHSGRGAPPHLSAPLPELAQDDASHWHLPGRERGSDGLRAEALLPQGVPTPRNAPPSGFSGGPSRERAASPLRTGSARSSVGDVTASVGRWAASSTRLQSRTALSLAGSSSLEPPRAFPTQAEARLAAERVMVANQKRPALRLQGALSTASLDSGAPQLRPPAPSTPPEPVPPLSIPSSPVTGQPGPAPFGVDPPPLDLEWSQVHQTEDTSPHPAHSLPGSASRQASSQSVPIQTARRHQAALQAATVRRQRDQRITDKIRRHKRQLERSDALAFSTGLSALRRHSTALHRMAGKARTHEAARDNVLAARSARAAGRAVARAKLHTEQASQRAGPMSARAALGSSEDDADSWAPGRGATHHTGVLYRPGPQLLHSTRYGER